MKVEMTECEQCAGCCTLWLSVWTDRFCTLILVNCNFSQCVPCRRVSCMWPAARTNREQTAEDTGSSKIDSALAMDALRYASCS